MAAFSARDKSEFRELVDQLALYFQIRDDLVNLKSDEYAAVAKVLPFCRLWCVRAGRHLSSCMSSPIRHTTRPARQPHAHAHPPTY